MLKLNLTLAALILVVAGSLAPAASLPPPLCRVQASATALFMGLRSIDISLRPECPPLGHAYVRLRSTTGATDPAYSWRELTQDAPGTRFLGVVEHWRPEWQAASGLAYRIPEQARRTDAP